MAAPIAPPMEELVAAITAGRYAVAIEEAAPQAVAAERADLPERLRAFNSRWRLLLQERCRADWQALAAECAANEGLWEQVWLADRAAARAATNGLARGSAGLSTADLAD